MLTEMRRRSLRGLLVLTNVLLASSPYMATADGGPARRVDPQPALQPSPAPPTHPAPGKVRPQPPPRSNPRGTTRSGAVASEAASDDDDAGEVAGAVAAGCCAGFIGALAEPSTPEDVDLPDVPPPVEEPGYGSPGYGAGGAPPVAAPGEPFDARAARLELEAAETHAFEACGPSPLEDDVHVRVLFASSGEPVDVQFIPEGFTNSEHGKCVEEVLLEARVPPFDGAPTAALRTMTLRAR